MLKDYYSILNIPVTASVKDIKQAYRKLAMLYHPDKKGNDLYASAKFNEIKEAYEVLTQPHLKEIYLQERWYKKANGVWVPDEPVTPSSILKQALTLNKSISNMDIHRMDYEGVASRIIQLIPGEVITKLNSFREEDINSTIISVLLHATKPLPLSPVQRVTNHLLLLAGNRKNDLDKIQRVLYQKQQQQRHESLRVYIILLLVLLLCILIYFSGR